MTLTKYSAYYFHKTKHIMSNYCKNDEMVAQFYQMNNEFCYLSGIKYVLKILEPFKNEIIIKYLDDGTKIIRNQPVLEIRGKFWVIIELEGIISGILSRCSKITTNAKKLTKLAFPSKIIFMLDRQDLYLNQEYDGYAAYVGGVRKFVTPAHLQFIDQKSNPIGTTPHSFLAMTQGDPIKATKLMFKYFPLEKNYVFLADFNNDVINDSLKVCNKFKEKIFGIRVDTSKNLIDKSLVNSKEKNINGACPALFKLLRNKLDEREFQNVKIIISSSIEEKELIQYNEMNAHPDYFGIGTAFLRGQINFTCDLLMINEKHSGKTGRMYNNIKMKFYK